MEMLVLGYFKNFPSEMWGFLTVASDVLSEIYENNELLMAAFSSIELIRRKQV
ncbi:MAG: hypothetical protein DID92_2727744274 [Candidatus Nitrotoga sp. SPKER]|nr:MAG: hypothetical protein DID92_2727744274 [Candidatus Nitrotoga sp. SPKER]